MSIRYECEQCGSVLKIKEDLAGKPGKCPKCKTPFTVPAESDELEQRELADSSPEATEDSEPVLASASSSGGDDFDVDAFLSSDDNLDTKSSKSRRREADLDADQSLGEIDDAPKTKRSKSRTDTETEGDNFQIRRGPDTPEKLAAARDSNDESETPIPARRPPGTNPNAAASNIASDLLSKSAKKGKKTNWDQVEPEKKDKPEFDWEALRYEAKTKLLPALGGAAVIFVLLYLVLMPMMGGGGYVPKLGLVTGTISVNGKPLPFSQVFFHPAEREHAVKGKTRKVTASSGQTDGTGRYEMMYDPTNHGVVIGKCRVEVMTTDYNGIQPKYFKNTPDAATVEVKAGKQTIDLDLSK